MSIRKHDVVFYEIFAEEREVITKHLPADLNAVFYERTIQEERHPEPEARLISTRTQSVIPESWLPNLDAVLSRSTGYDHLSYLLDQNLQLGYLPSYCARSVAEHALLLWTCLLKKLPEQIDSFKCFNRSGITGMELMGRRMLVIGVGNIGSEIVQIATALGMQAHGLDLAEKHSGVTYIAADADLSVYDIFVCAMNLTDANRDYFDQSFFDRVKNGCLFINVARGEMSPHAVLLKNLQTGKLGGVGLDVFDDEQDLATQLRHKTWLTEDAQLLLDMSELPNVILTPHNAFNTVEATARKAEQTVQQVTGFLKNREFVWPVR